MLLSMPNEILAEIIRFVPWREPLFNTCKRLAAFAVSMSARDSEDLRLWFDVMLSWIDHPANEYKWLSKKAMLDSFDELYLALEWTGVHWMTKQYPIVARWAPVHNLPRFNISQIMHTSEAAMWNRLFYSSLSPIATYLDLRATFAHHWSVHIRIRNGEVIFHIDATTCIRAIIPPVCSSRHYWYGLVLAKILDNKRVTY
jgi:hypothetical protein